MTLRVVAVALLVALLPDPARAAGVVTLSWDHPATPGQPAVVSRAYAGPGTYDLYATLTGQSDPVSIYILRVQVFSGVPICPRNPLPAAWRFDESGCRAGNVCFSTGAFSPTPTQQWTDVQFHSSTPPIESVWYQVGEMYDPPAGTDPARTYVLARFRFTFPEDGCGGLTDSVYVAGVASAWFDGAGVLGQWAWSHGREFVFWNHAVTHGIPPHCGEVPETSGAPEPLAVDSEIPRCALPVPASATSWGRLKATYR